MSEKILFLTGKLAERSLNLVLNEIQAEKLNKTNKSSDFSFKVIQIGVSVAALMTPELIGRRLANADGFDRILLPGLCKGDLGQLAQQYGIPVELGPCDLKDLPQFFGQGGQKPDLSKHDVKIFAEVVDAPYLSIDAIIEKAKKFRQQGADVIDLGCIPNTPFLHLPETISALKSLNFYVSVDSLNNEDLLLAGKSGADYLLSLNKTNLWIAEEVASTPVLIPSKSGNLSSLYDAVEHMLKLGKSFIADPILDPIPFGFTNSLVRYERLRKRYPDIQVMMGVGNLTELTDADTTGINAILFGIIAELGIQNVLATSVSPHAVNAIAEANIARRIMYKANQDKRLPRGYSSELLGLHDRKPYGYDSREIAELASQIKDPSFRIMVNEDGIQIFNRDGLNVGIDPFDLYPHLKVEDDASHAFYLGVELARAQIAWQLQKRYSQDEELRWGVNSPQGENNARQEHRNSSLKLKKENKQL